MTIDWTQDPEEIAALESLRQIFAEAAESLHKVAAEAGETPPAGGHNPVP